MATDNKKKKAYHCPSCDEPYSKKDFAICPFCAGDGGSFTKREWKPTKAQKKDFAKKNEG